MSWRVVKLGDLIEIKHGYAFKSKFFSDAGKYILLTPGNCHESGGLKLKGSKEKYYTGDIPEDYLLAEGDLLIVMTDLVNIAPILGGAFIIPEHDRFLHNQRLGLVQINDTTCIDKKFLYYLLNTNDYRAQVRGSASGATVRHTSPERIERCAVRIPDHIREQQRVASILSAYDDLIENNRRRIELLEQAARLLYKEWFVHLHFPGHEHVEIIDGVPEGWEKTNLGTALTLQRGFDLPVEARKAGSIPIYASTGVHGYHDVAKVEGPGVVTGRSGSLGTVIYVTDSFWPLNTTLWVKEFKRVSPIFAYHLLLGLKLEQYDGGAAVPTLNRNDVHRIDVLIPSYRLINLFSETVTPFYKQISKFKKYSDKLKEARDLILPRLMNGEIVI